MITLLLLLPVAAVLVGLYVLALPRGSRWRRFDSGLVLALALLAAAWAWSAASSHAPGTGPIWPDLLAAAGAYPILAVGLAVGLAWRHRRARRERGG